MSREGLQQLLASELLLQMRGHIKLELRVRLHRPQAMDGFNDARTAFACDAS
jgi:hypothetical protein